MKIKIKNPKKSGYSAKGNVGSKSYDIMFYEGPVIVTEEVGKKLLAGSPMYEVVSGEYTKTKLKSTGYTKEELEKMGMKELRKIGEPLGARDTKKSELISEIMSKKKEEK